VYGTDYTIWADQLDRALLIHARRDRKIECHCSKPLTFVDSTIRIPHFRHLTGSCSIIGAERDTETHNEGLEYVGQILRSNLKHAHVEKEAIFKVPGGKRRTDIFVELEGGNSICYELQCSPITEEEFVERTTAYESLGNEVVWIFGPDAAGVKYLRPNGLAGGSTVPIKFIALSALRENSYLALYFPTQKERLRIAYCADGVLDRTRDFTITRGQNKFLVTMPDVRLALFPLEFEKDGFPYARNFPSGELAVLDLNSVRKKKLQTVYARELIRAGVQATSSKPRKTQVRKASKRTQRKKTAIKDWKSSGPRCILCGSISTIISVSSVVVSWTTIAQK